MEDKPGAPVFRLVQAVVGRAPGDGAGDVEEVAIRSTLNVGALDLVGCSRVRLEEPQRGMARRKMEAYRKLGCEQSWTCAPYQAGHRPAFGSDVAWGESNAVVFCNSVL
ncbi:MAG: DUF521 domain-containing protein, partial [Mesorhizobium sp.]|nr:DUF521 domain-containing protein [Mesorhizobium sp.]